MKYGESLCCKMTKEIIPTYVLLFGPKDQIEMKLLNLVLTLINIHAIAIS